MLIICTVGGDRFMSTRTLRHNDTSSFVALRKAGGYITGSDYIQRLPIATNAEPGGKNNVADGTAMLRTQNNKDIISVIGGAFCLIRTVTLNPASASNSRLPTTVFRYSYPAYPSSKIPYNTTYPLTTPVTYANGSIDFRVAIIADQDLLARDKKVQSSFTSYLKSGTFTIHAGWTGGMIVWDEGDESAEEAKRIAAENGQVIQSEFGFGSRGMELSSIVTFNGKLYVSDDKTGIVFHLINHTVVPWVILADGDGTKPKGFKCEWSIVKDQKLYVGSHSADIKLPHADGPSVEAPQRWVKRISKEGFIEHLNWNPLYQALENHLGIKPPGYVMHEAVLWSERLRKWYFLPRQINPQNYTEERHPYTCNNVMIVVSEDFSEFKNVSIGEPNPLFGFTSARFVPGTDETVVVALRIMEVDDLFSSRIVVFNINGSILLVEEEILEGLKYEGLEFV
ncbi:Soluble calcium-activated nucleotidase 1 [Hypsibius exemplaris]|uniref:Soluble calcium-activated nucleotidase 1 n=1 Tax=Hypsibius exemplaris TaxID=2072580 RepID=A0A9X6RM70_HYPEX|nr:Soluble calcium-activated nucleotidase 1 [Hypsibius exemplaris]